MNNIIRLIKSNKKATLTSIVLFFGVFSLSFYCFYVTSFSYVDVYISDLPLHIKVSQYIFNAEFKELTSLAHIEGYLLFHICTKILSVFVGKNYEFASALILALSNTATFMILLLFAYKKKVEFKISNIFLMFGMLFIIGIPLLGKLYLPQGAPNVWHNPTFTFSRPFALLSFYYFLETVECYVHNKAMKKNMLLFAIFSLISCYSKPSFTLVYIPVAGIYTAYTMLKTRFRDYKFYLGLLLAVAPTIILLLYQYTLSFESKLEIVVKFGTFLNLSLTDSILSLLAIVFFPLMYLIMYIKEKKDLLFTMSWFVFIFGAIQYFFFDTLPVAYGDFGWGYFMATYLLYQTTLLEILSKEKSLKRNILIAVFIIQALLGFYFFVQQIELRGFMI